MNVHPGSARSSFDRSLRTYTSTARSLGTIGWPQQSSYSSSRESTSSGRRISSTNSSNSRGVSGITCPSARAVYAAGATSSAPARSFSFALRDVTLGRIARIRGRGVIEL